ncbi:MAG TPA: hypothetical protein PLE30_02235 [Candidatus Kapabacteria bacterium]|nr:hypothetical protein [Candidatus Kapabacteria bacterium]
MKNLLFIFTLAIILLTACSECPVRQVEPIFVCETRIVTMEKFNPNFTIIGANAILDSDYNISIYQFPDNSASSGSFPNDSRFEGKVALPLASFPFSNNDTIYYANIMDTYPTNEQLLGDFLVQNVNVASNPNTAYLRIKGSIALFSQGLFTEDSQVFCDYVKANQADLTDSLSRFTADNLYGRNQRGSTINSYNANNIFISNESGKILGKAGDFGIPLPNNSVINQLNNAAAKLISIDLLVQPGNVYLYIARNGKRFVIVITEIRQTAIPPFRKRVSMMLYPLDK